MNINIFLKYLKVMNFVLLYPLFYTRRVKRLLISCQLRSGTDEAVQVNYWRVVKIETLIVSAPFPVILVRSQFANWFVTCCQVITTNAVRKGSLRGLSLGQRKNSNGHSFVRWGAFLCILQQCLPGGFS